MTSRLSERIKISKDDETQYGSAANGLQVGSGYDVVVKRESDDTALVCITEVATRKEWLGEIGVERGEDLQARAVQIGDCPQFGDGRWAADDSDDWDHYADRWDAIAVSGDLALDADTSHDTAQVMYECYGRGLDTERAGFIDVQAIEYDWLDEEDDYIVLRHHREELHRRMRDDEALALIEMAREVRGWAERVEAALLEAVDAYERNDVDATISALDRASSEERGGGGDDPATSQLRDSLIIE